MFYSRRFLSLASLAGPLSPSRVHSRSEQTNAPETSSTSCLWRPFRRGGSARFGGFFNAGRCQHRACAFPGVSAACLAHVVLGVWRFVCMMRPVCPRCFGCLVCLVCLWCAAGVSGVPATRARACLSRFAFNVVHVRFLSKLSCVLGLRFESASLRVCSPPHPPSCSS